MIIMQKYMRRLQLGSAVKRQKLFAQNWTEKTVSFIFAHTIITTFVLKTQTKKHSCVKNKLYANCGTQATYAWLLFHW